MDRFGFYLVLFFSSHLLVKETLSRKLWKRIKQQPANWIFLKSLPETWKGDSSGFGFWQPRSLEPEEDHLSMELDVLILCAFSWGERVPDSCFCSSSHYCLWRVAFALICWVQSYVRLDGEMWPCLKYQAHCSVKVWQIFLLAFHDNLIYQVHSITFLMKLIQLASICFIVILRKK